MGQTEVQCGILSTRGLRHQSSPWSSAKGHAAVTVGPWLVYYLLVLHHLSFSWALTVSYTSVHQCRVHEIWSFLLGLHVFCGSRWWNTFKIQTSQVWNSLRSEIQISECCHLAIEHPPKVGGWRSSERMSGSHSPFLSSFLWEQSTNPCRLFQVCHHCRIKGNLHFCDWLILFSVISSAIQSGLNPPRDHKILENLMKVKDLPIKKMDIKK